MLGALQEKSSQRSDARTKMIAALAYLIGQKESLAIVPAFRIRSNSSRYVMYVGMVWYGV